MSSLSLLHEELVWVLLLVYSSAVPQVSLSEWSLALLALGLGKQGPLKADKLSELPPLLYRSI